MKANASHVHAKNVPNEVAEITRKKRLPVAVLSFGNKKYCPKIDEMHRDPSSKSIFYFIFR